MQPERTKPSLGEARQAVLPRRPAIQEQYRDYIRGLGPDAAGQLALGPDDKSITERARLNTAAKAEGVNLHIQRRGSTMVFWLTDEPPPTRASSRPGRKRGS
jgi:hypothetical protein